MTPRPVILSVDDSLDDALLLRRACRKAAVGFDLQIVDEGRKGEEYLRGAGSYADRERFPLPQLVLLDLNMPVKTGFEVLEWWREQPERVPVAVFTSSENEEDIRAAYARGATYYVAKPVNFTLLVQMMSCLDEALRTRALHPWPTLARLGGFKPRPG